MQHHQALDRVHHYQHSRTATGGSASTNNNNGELEGEREQDRQLEVAEAQQAEQSMTRLWENFLNASNLGQSSSDWRLALPTLATSLTLHLIDGEFRISAGLDGSSGLF